MKATNPQQFWIKVKKSAGCWTWIGSKNNHGYGQLNRSIGGKLVRWIASRFSWTLHNGPIPPGLRVLHDCDNPPCVNPNHLFLGTQKDNAQDCIAKGRWSHATSKANGYKVGKMGDTRRGEANGSAKLTEGQVKQMRALAKTGIIDRKLADMFGISRVVAQKIRTRKLWKHI